MAAAAQGSGGRHDWTILAPSKSAEKIGLVKCSREGLSIPVLRLACWPVHLSLQTGRSDAIAAP